MTQKGHGVIRGRRDLLYDPKGHGDLCGRFDIVYDPKMSGGHERSPWPTLWPQRWQWPLWSVWPSLWPQKVPGSLEVAKTYFMTQRSTWPLTLTLTQGPSIWSDRWPQMSKQHYNAIRQSWRSILSKYVVSSCSFLVMLTTTLHKVIR